MRGKVVLITGANSGVGFATARRLAELGATIVMVCRDAGRGAAARDAVAKAAKGEAPMLLIADLSSQIAIRALAHELHARFDRIDVLVNNAGGIFADRELTADGIEKTFATNHLAPFLLTNLVLDLLRAAPAGRIVTVAAQTYSSALDFDNLQSERHHNFLGAYRRSKLANILFTYELARRLEGSGVTANCLCPGPTVTRFGDDMRGLPSLFPLLMKQIPFLFASPEKGAGTSIYLASSPEVARLSGRFFSGQRERRTKPVTRDTEVAARLWRISAELVGLPVEQHVAPDRMPLEMSSRGTS
ncbi:NAD(P)-dependent dehydrogenase, short-chain alcohol dehydrogenase family [Rhizobiales bacterium GAS113]|nr:NAD(P)-dependent dehydrogenase, short-chain alcohol dehydrogenase family [Rhizobiales bacterium GAS113]